MTPAQKQSLASAAKRWGLLASIAVPLLTWGNGRVNATLARKLDAAEFHASRDSQEFRHSLDTLKQSNDYRNLMGVVLRVDSNVKAMRARR